MKITLVCQEVPYPAIHGSRIDMWRRIKAFADRGVELQIIFWWFGTEPTVEEIAEIHKYARKVHSIQLEQTLISRLRRATDLFFYPLGTSSRRIKGQKLASLTDEVSDFDPDVIFLDGIHGGAIATSLSQKLKIPIVFRSHNIEHLYVRDLLSSAIGLKSKIKRYLSVFHVEKYEKKLLSNSAIFYDISADDLKFWESLNYTNGRLLPPIIEFSEHLPAPDLERNLEQLESYDIVFLGNLNAENNVEAVIWFLSEVLPLIHQQLPNTTALIAGFNPVSRIPLLCEKIPGVSLLINPPSASDIYRSGRVLINPILTGSGVKIKSVDMLTFGKPIISTTEGVSGLPDIVKQYFKIADSQLAFAEATIEFLSKNVDVPIIDRQLLESYFGPKIIENVIADLESLIHI
jgi:polysaccharide biosynthesis protein PslH